METVRASKAEKFLKLSAGLWAEAAEKRTPRQDNTPKRALQAACRRIEADHCERMALACEALADLHDHGAVLGVLVDVKTKADVHRLTRHTLDHSGGYYSIRDTGEYADKSPAGLALQELIGRRQDPQAVADRKRAARIAELEADVRFREIPGFFPTPAPLADKLVDLLRLHGGETILEPSAGKGDLLDALHRRPLPFVGGLTVVEYNHSLCDILEAKGYAVRRGDFLAERDLGPFDRVLMNPPFENGADCDHVRHAYGLLKPGGRLVAVVSEGALHRAGKRETEFRRWLDYVRAEQVQVAAGAFKNGFNPTGVAVRVLVIDRRRAWGEELD